MTYTESTHLNDFIYEFYKGYYGKDLLLKLTNETEIEKDLGITGDDADDFLKELVEKFNLDYSSFDGNKYFGYEHESFDVFFPILRFIFGKKKFLPRAKKDREKLTIGKLNEAIQTGKLI